MLGFRPDDELMCVYVEGCRAKVIKVDKESDLALLEMCHTSKVAKAPTFQTSPTKDDKLFLIARPHGDKVVSHGSFYGNYMLGTQEYWSVKIDSRDGFSGSPVYNSKAEVVGVFSVTTGREAGTNKSKFSCSKVIGGLQLHETLVTFQIESAATRGC